jgi:hypothetical protein
MDGSTAAALAGPTGLTAWVAANGQVLYFFAQLAYWFFMVVFVGYGVAQYKRWVNFQLGTGHSGQLRKPAEAPASTQPKSEISIEEFVE